MHGQAIPAVLQGAASNFIVPAGGTKSFTRWFTVGEGSGNDAIDAQVDLLGTPAGSLRVCVSVANAGQDPLPGARVAAARDNLGGTSGANVLRGHWVTGADGCSEGRLPAGNYLVAAAKEGFPYQGGGSVPDTTLVNVPDGGLAELSIALPETGRLRVLVEDEFGPTPARVGVLGFDPSPEPLLLASLLSLNDLEELALRGRHHGSDSQRLLPHRVRGQGRHAGRGRVRSRARRLPGRGIARQRVLALHGAGDDQRGPDDGGRRADRARARDAGLHLLRLSRPPDRQPGFADQLPQSRALDGRRGRREHRRDRPLRHHRPEPDDRGARTGSLRQLHAG